MPKKKSLDKLYEKALAAAADEKIRAEMKKFADEHHVGEHVSMRYAGRDLLGEVVSINFPRNPRSYPYLTVKHFNGEYWPLEPLVTEVRILKPTYPKDEDEDVAVTAAGKLSKRGLLQAARHGKALGTSDED